jgi:hypothetical protein
MKWKFLGYGVEVELRFPLTQLSESKLGTSYKLQFDQAMNMLAGFKSVEQPLEIIG